VQDIYKQSQQTIQYAGAGTTTTADDSFVYARQLRAWDIRNPYNTYRAFQGKSSTTGQSFWILVDCGNITWIGNWQRPTPPPGPQLQIKKSVAKSTETLKPGDSFGYRLEYRNEVIGSVAQNVVIEDDLDLKNFDVISPRGLDIRNGRLFYPVGTLNGSTSFNILELTVRLKNPLPSPLQICNVARIVSSNAAVAQSENACVNVLTPCPYDPSIPDVNNPNCTKPAVVCSVVDAAILQTTRTVTFKTTVTTSNNSVVTIKSYNYDFGDDTQQSFSSNSFVHQTEHVFRPGTFTTSVTVRYRAPSDSGVTDQQVSCQVPITIDEDKPLGQEKNVANLTQGLSGDAVRNSRVAGGDVLEYTLYTLNSQNYDRANVTISDYIGDILDYASLDLEALKATGGKFDATTNKVIWANITIPANSKHKSQFKVTLKNPIPTTNQPSTVSTSFDCRISNQYGNEITLQVQCPVVKGIETIPNTGPGTSIIGGMSITLIVGYFFARARLLSKELDIIRTDYVATGGM
jgi:hypothetical protein